jgi:hypothetical protein
VLVKELDNPYFAGVIAGVRAHADAHGYAVLVSSSERDPEAERQAVALLTAGLTAGDVAGLIVTPVLDDDADLSHLFELKRRQVPFVLLGGIRGVPSSLVGVDNLTASRAAGEHLIAQGHTRIVHFGGPAGLDPGRRARGRAAARVRRGARAVHRRRRDPRRRPPRGRLPGRARLPRRDAGRGPRDRGDLLQRPGRHRRVPGDRRGGAARAGRHGRGGLRRHPAARVPAGAAHVGAGADVRDGPAGRRAAPPPRRRRHRGADAEDLPRRRARRAQLDAGAPRGRRTAAARAGRRGGRRPGGRRPAGGGVALGAAPGAAPEAGAPA